MCRDEDTEQQDLSHRQHHGINYKPPVHWMKAISACHSWYQIALADKSLWTDIYLPSMSPTAAEMLIERSGSVEIALYYRTNNSGTPYGTRRDGVCRTFIEQAVRTYPDRVGKLYIATDDHSYLSALFSRPLSSLTTLRIINMIPGLGSGMHIDSSTLTRHPSLTSLKLDKYTVTPCCPALDNLTHLKLGYSQWERSPTGQKSIVGTKLNDLLARMVHVRRIELDISGPDRNKSNDTTVRFEDCRIHLPASLEEIVLSERLPSGSYKNGASPVLEPHSRGYRHHSRIFLFSFPRRVLQRAHTSFHLGLVTTNNRDIRRDASSAVAPRQRA
ncbi:hypothetical protein OF83DRAFT_139480 [Amylostereum chailletii]|nr:hypothetical protein OF83DRAFT_139480 [Amylostereum chailletii]